MDRATEPPVRRRETLTSLQLQRAADQLQDAIQSARQRRSAYSSSSLSLLSESSEDDDGGDDDEPNHEDGEKDENSDYSNVSPTTKVLDFEAPTSQKKIHLSSLVAPQSLVTRRSGASLTLNDLYASPLRPPRVQRRPESQSPSLETKEESPETEKAWAKRVVELPRVDMHAKKALERLQQDVEAQAKANRDAQDQLKRAMCEISKVVARIVGQNDEVTDDLLMMKVVDAEKVKRVSDGWLDTLEQWNAARDNENRVPRDEMVTKIRAVKDAHARARADLEDMVASRNREIEALREQVEATERRTEDVEMHHRSAVHELVLVVDRVQMENEDSRAHLLKAFAERSTAFDETVSSAEQQQRHVLNLLAQLRQSELRELQWEMIFEDQSQATTRTQERLGMFLEETSQLHSRPHTQEHLAGASHATPIPLSPRGRRTSLASSTTSSELQQYQQRIEFLEDQLRDVKEQIHCDHHQFLYEQKKWEVEKKHMGHDVEEVHGVSVKVLKLLLIREKLLKRQEKKLQKRIDKLKADEHATREKEDALHVSIETALQECAVALLYVRQLAMAHPSSQSASLPVKPIKLVRVLKRLKILQQELPTPTARSRGEDQFPTSPSNATRTTATYHPEARFA